MSIPTHNLYDFVHQATERRFWLVYFYPWGSRDLNDLTDYQVDKKFLNGANGIPDKHRFDFAKFDTVPLTTTNNHRLCKWTQPQLICHDQEPLQFDLYSEESEFIKNFKVPIEFPSMSLRNVNPFCIHKKSILLHSELNSAELTKFENTGFFVGAYWWSHAVIARDWYRYAESDLSLSSNLNTDKKLFLTYCRRIDNTSKYRQTFLDQLYINDLKKDCVTSSLADTEKIPADLSAEYHSSDFINTSISVVLETTFDSRIHLTEKTLRPIACGHPFIIANGPGCLKLLRSYGFKTFHPYIDESYDDMSDDNERLWAIIKEMKRLASLSKPELTRILDSCQLIAEYNKNMFFSKNFMLKIESELKNNVEAAFDKCKNQYYIDPWIQVLDRRRRERKNKIAIKKTEEVLAMFRLIKKLKNKN